MAHAPFWGLITALVTPLQKDGALDLAAFHQLLEYQKNGGAHGVVIGGTTGESPTLTDEELRCLLLAALTHRSPDFHIYANAGTNDTARSIQRAVSFAGLCVDNQVLDGLLVVTPYYNKPLPEHLVRHFSHVCASIPHLPVCAYNVPSRTGVSLSSQSLCRIAQKNPNLVAIKEASGNMPLVTQMRCDLNALGKNDLRILSGDDATYGPALLCGAVGVISVTSNLIPRTMRALLDAACEGQWARLQELHLQTFCINSGLFLVPNPVGIKWALAQKGLCLATIRPPLYEPDPQESAALQAVLTQLEAIPSLCH